MAFISDDDMDQMVQSGQAYDPGSSSAPSAPQTQPAQGVEQPQQQQGRVISDEEMERMMQTGEAKRGAPVKSGAGGAFVREAAESLAPTIGSLPAVGPGFEAGAVIGGVLSGGNPIGAGIGGVIGAGAAAMGAGYLISKGQDWVMDQLGMRDSGWFSREQRQADVEQHPYWSTAGGVAGAFVPFGGAGALAGKTLSNSEKLAARKAALLSSGVFAGQEAGMELYNEGSVNPGRVAIAGAGGYFLGHPRPFAEGLISKGSEMTGLKGVSDKYFAGRPGEGKTDVDQALEKAVSNSVPMTSDSRGTASDRTNPDKNETQAGSLPGVGNADKGAGTTDGRPDYTKSESRPSQQQSGLSVGTVFDDIKNQMQGAAGSANEKPLLNQQPTEAAASRAEKLVGTPLDAQVQAMAQQGKTATEIANFTGEHPNVVRALRDRTFEPETTQDAPTKPGGNSQLPEPIKQATPGPEPRQVEDTTQTIQPRGEADFGDAAIQQLKPGIPGVGRGQAAPVQKPVQAPAAALELGKGIPGVKTAPKTDQQYRKVVRDVLTQLDKGDKPEFAQAAKAIREAKSNAEREQLSMRAQQILAGKDAGTQVYEQVRTRKAYKLSNGEEVANPQVQKVRQASLDAREKLWNDKELAKLPVEAGDTSPEARQKMQEYAKKVNAAAIEAGNGKHPVDTYKHRDAPWRWLNETRKLLGKGGATPAKLNAYYGMVKDLREGGAEGLKSVAAERKGEADTELRQGPTAEDVEALVAAPRTSERTEFDLMPEWKPGAEESKQYIDSSNELRQWVNKLSEEDYAKLEGQHPDLEQDVKLTQDPEHLLDVYQTGLENAPEAKAKPVKTEVGKKAGPSGATKVGAVENDWRTLAKDSPEFKAIAEKALADAAKRDKEQGIVKPSKRGKYADVSEKPLPAEESAEDLIARYHTEQEPSKANRGLIDTIKAGINDESGAVMLPQKVVDIVTRGPSEQYHAASLTTKEAIDAGAVADDLHTLDQTTVNDLVRHQKEMRDQPEEFKDGKTQEDIYLKREANDLDSLPKKVRDWYEKYLRPIFDENNTLYQWAKTLNPKLLEDLNLNHVHRMMEGKSVIDWINDPVSGAKRSLFTLVSPLMDRTFKAIQEKDTGARGVISQEKDKIGFVLWDRGKALNVPMAAFDFKNGHEFKIGNKEYVVTEALTPEIEAHARNSDGDMVRYYKNGALSAIIANVKLKEAVRHMLYLKSLENSAEFKALAQRTQPDRSDPVKGDWTQTILKQFEGYWMHPKLAAVLDDYAQPGFGGNKTLDWFRDVSRAVTKLMFWLPTPHMLNVGAHWWVARDWRWLEPFAYKDLAETGIDAVKSVATQDEFQTEMRKLGAGTLSGGIMSTDFARKVAKEFGMQIQREPSKWDPVIKTLGLQGARELTDAIYQGSSRIMWAANDMFLTQLVKENMRRGMGMKEAIVTAERHIPNYRVPAEIFGSRAMSQFLQDPLVSAFGRYRYGVFNSYAHIIKGLVNGTGEQRKEAVGNLVAMGMLAFMVYPVLNKWAQYLTGNKEAEQRPRGPLAIPQHVYRTFISRDKHEDLPTTLKATLTMPPLPAAILEAYNNKDWAGRPVVQEGRIRGIKDVGRRVEQAGEHMARSLISPIGSAENAIGRKQPIGDAMRDMLLDIKNPSNRAIAFERKDERKNIMEANRRARKTTNPGENFYNWLFGKGP